MTERFKLPEKWVIKANNQHEAEVIARYATTLATAKGYAPWTPKNCLEYYLEICDGEYVGGSPSLGGNHLITFKEFTELVLNKIDYTIAGTKIPPIPVGTRFRTVKWSNNSTDDIFGSIKNFVSYGYTLFKGEKYILCDRIGYLDSDYFMIRLSDIEGLTNNKQTNMENKEITGLKIKEDILARVNKVSFLKGIAQMGLIHDQIGLGMPDEDLLLSAIFNNTLVKNNFIDAGVYDLWFEPVYKPIEKIITLSNGNEVKVIEGKSIVAEQQAIDVKDLENLLAISCPNLNSWTVSVEDITYKIGCWERVTKKDILLILNAYNI